MFRQIIFPPLPSSEKIPAAASDLINDMFHAMNDLIWGLNYWFDYTETGIRFFVKCPVCEKKYLYSTLPLNGDVERIYTDVEDNEKFYADEWERECPDKACHEEVRDKVWGRLDK